MKEAKAAPLAWSIRIRGFPMSHAELYGVGGPRVSPPLMAFVQTHSRLLPMPTPMPMLQLGCVKVNKYPFQV